MVGGDDLEVTNILDPDLGDKDMNVTEQDIDLELGEALNDSDFDDFNLDEDMDVLDLDELEDQKTPGRSSSPREEMTIVTGMETIQFRAENVTLYEEQSDFGEDEFDEDDLDFELEEVVHEDAEDDFGQEFEDEFDEDIDFDLDEAVPSPPEGAGVEGTGFVLEKQAAGQEPDFDEDVDFDLEEPSLEEVADEDEDDLDFELDDYAEPLEPAAPVMDGAALESAPADAIIEEDAEVDFDLEDLSAAPAEPPAAMEVPTETAGEAEEFDIEDFAPDFETEPAPPVGAAADEPAAEEFMEKEADLSWDEPTAETVADGAALAEETVWPEMEAEAGASEDAAMETPAVPAAELGLTDILAESEKEEDEDVEIKAVENVDTDVPPDGKGFDLDTILAGDEEPEIEDEFAEEIDEGLEFESEFGIEEEVVESSDGPDVSEFDETADREADLAAAGALGQLAAKAQAGEYDEPDFDADFGPARAMGAAEGYVPADFGLDMEHIEAIIRDSVRETVQAAVHETVEAAVQSALQETVGRVLERILPGIIEEVVGREMGKLLEELDEE